MANINGLRNTVALMLSDDYRERFVAEYRQLMIRIESLSKMLDNWDNGSLEFTPQCPRSILEDQLLCMGKYARILKLRAELEGINLEI